MRLIMAFALCLASSVALGQESPFLLRGLEHLQHGRYDEARESFDEVELDTETTPEERILLVVGRCRSFVEQGEWDKAISIARAGVEKHRESSRLWALLAECQFETGKSTEAARSVKQALDLDSQQPNAVLIYAHLLTEAGRYDEAVDQYRWFVRHYNRTQPDDAETLVTIGEGAAQYARWKGVSDVFKFLVNTLCADARKASPDFWQAYVLSGDLLMEKYNRKQAVPEYHAALAINPNCAAAHVGLGQVELTENRLQSADEFADAAIEANAHCIPALLLKADIALISDDHAAARPFIERALEVNPNNQHALARLAVCQLRDVGIPENDALQAVLSHLDDPKAWNGVQDEDFGKTLSRLLELNPKPGLFLADVGNFLDSGRKFDAAKLFYQAAIETMPQLSGPKTALGLLYMRTGELGKAQEILDAAFDADRFHVRVSNMRKLLEVLNTYVLIESPHFVIHCDPSERALGQEMSAYLESIYDELTKTYEYEPPTRTHFEIYSDAKDQNAHAWFSTRMSGLPWIQTIGASTGMIVALASPEKTQEKYNWARVLKHEFVHILTLQKTGFAMPHWYTEALAVTSEGDQIPEAWYDLLIQRVASGDTYNLATLNQGFQRPKSRDDWTMAYCQSRFYAKYFTDEFGRDALTRLTRAYASGMTTEEAIPSIFGVNVEDVEEGYAKFLTETAEEFAKGRLPSAPNLTLAEAAVHENPQNATAQGQLAYALISRRQIREGFVAAEKAHELDPAEPVSATFLARRALVERETEKAITLLEGALDEDSPNALLLDAYIEAAMRDNDPELAEKLAGQLVKLYPLEISYVKDLILAKTANGRPDEEIKPLLEQVAARDVDDAPVRKRLTRLALAAKDFESASKWGNEALFIDTLDAEIQRAVAEAAYQLRDFERAARAFLVLETLGSLTDVDRLQYAKAMKRAGQKSSARKLLLEIPSDSEQYREAQTELKLLDAGR
ncbi:MAG: tetratricopeptide repeat protein [Planctomycetaceae bacterium]|nr:tetratricopeptide repeat protein [Planctomycetaceae bacterium]MCB9951533.1 tetratricopeptide repeat protein [Planctomycetaceae bacterium]